jgi:hypothetical protein
VKRVLLVVAVLLLTAGVASAADRPVQVNDLIEHAKEYDGQQVTVTGEVIGDIMRRGDTGWINVSDGSGDLGVWAPTAALASVKVAGRYHTRGDQVEVTGIFHRGDPAQGGDLDLQATSVRVVEAGAPVAHPIDEGSFVLAGASLLVATALGVRLRFRTRATGLLR